MVLQYVTLHNGVTIPQLGFGTYLIPNEQVADAIKHALDAGYRHIDTAQYYKNESGIGEALKASGINREDLFITTKVWNSHHGYEQTLEAFEESLERLKLDYIDLYLVHWPCPKFDKYVETYKALETLYKEGKVRAIGVCNFDIEHLERLFAECEIKPMINQVECHPYFQQKEMKRFCREHQIHFESWSPLYRGEEVLEEPIIKELAKKHGKTPAQIILRWHLQEGSIVIPKSVHPERIRKNIDVFDFTLSDEDMELIASLDRNQQRGPVPKEMHRI